MSKDIKPHKKVVELVVVYKQRHVDDEDAVEHRLALVHVGGEVKVQRHIQRPGDPEDYTQERLRQMFIDAAGDLAGLLADSPELPL